MHFEKIIVLDDEMIIRKSLSEQLRKKRYSVATAGSISEAEDLLSKDHFDLMFVDVNLPDGSGMDFLKRFSEEPDAPMIVMISGYGSVESAVECMQLGAFDYVLKPFSSEQINVILKKAESFNHMVKVNRYFSESSNETGQLVGDTVEVKNLKKMVKKVAATEATVLITGENGTGKELVAHELYKQSALATAPYIRVNCAAISENLIESEFFGHEKGAFTGATQRREGRFELANGGTILLDEIGEISLNVQVKLLRVLQEREFERVGGNKTISVNVRVLATTNRNLLEAVERGEFREDLYYRLNVFPIHVPPLRERRGDIPLLANTFLQRFGRKHGITLPGFSKEALGSLLEHDWPGNVRELQNTIERSVILSDAGRAVSSEALGLVPKLTAPAEAPGIVALDSAEPANERPGVRRRMTPPVFGIAEREGAEERLGEEDSEVSEGVVPLEEIEKRHILKMLGHTSGNRTQAAQHLKISIRTLRNKLHQYRAEGELIP